MRLQFSVRTVLYSVSALAAFVAAVFVLSVFLRGWTVPSSLIHSSLFRNYAARIGVSYTLSSLRIGCFTSDCPEALIFSGLDVELDIPEPFKVHLGNLLARRGTGIHAGDLRVQFGARRPLVSAKAIQADLGAQTGGVTGLEIGLRPDAPIRVEIVDFNASNARASIRGIELPMAERSTLHLDQVSIEQWDRSPDDWIVVERVAMDGMRVGLAERTSNLTVCEELPASIALNRQAFEPAAALSGFLANALRTIRQDLLRLSIAIAAIAAVLKLLSVFWIGRWPARLALAAFPAGAPFLLYFWLRSGRALVAFVLIAAGVLLAIAIAFRVFVYSKGERWYQRWEPFFVDVAAMLVLLPLLGYGLELPATPPGPSGVRIEELVSSGAVIEPPDQTAIQVSPVLANSVSVSIPSGGRDVEATVASLRVAPTQISPTDFVRIALSATIVDRVRVVFDSSRMESRSIFARVRTRGSFSASGLLPEFQEIEFLKGIGSRVGPMGFAVDLTASSANLQSPVVWEFGSAPEAVAVNAALDLDPVECSAAFRLATRLAVGPLTLVAKASGDSESLNLSSFSSEPGSSIQIAQGSGSIRFAPRTDLRLDVGNVHVPPSASGAPNVEVQSAHITASLPRRGQVGSRNAKVEIGPATVTTAQGTAVRLDELRGDYVGQGQTHTATLVFGATGITRPRSAPVRIADARLDFDSRSGQQTAVLHVGAASVGAAQNPTLRIAGTRITFDRSPRGAAVPVSLRTRVEDLRYEDRTDAVIQADFPLLEATIEGQTSAEIPPRSFDGSADFRVSQKDSVPILAFNKAIALSVNFPERRILVPTQEVTLREAIVSRTASEIPFRLALSGQAQSGAGEIAARLVLPQFELNRGSFRFSASDLDLTTRNEWNDSDSTATLRYSGNLQVQLPRGPSGICLDEVSMLDVATNGTASGIAGGASLPDLPVSPCVSLPTLPTEIMTRVAGVLPAERGRPLEFGNSSGGGIRIGQIRPVINSVQIEGGHLNRLGSGVEILGVKNLRGEGDLDLKLDVFQDNSKLQLEGWALGGDGTRLGDLAAVSTSSRTTLDAIQRVPASRLLEAAGPVLTDLGLNLQGMAPEARLADFHVEAGFEGDRLREAEIAVSLSGGAIAAVRNPDLAWSAASSPSNAGPTFKMRVERSPLETTTSDRFVANIEIPRTEIGITTNAGLTANFTAALRAEARGSVLSETEPPSSPLMTSMAEVVERLSTQVDRVSRILVPEESTPATPAMNAQWDLALRQIDPGRPFLRLTPDVAETRLSSASFNVGWGTGSERSRVEADGAVDALLALDSSGLLLDARTPMNARLTRPDNSETRLETDLPIQVVFSPRLAQAPQREALWDADHYAQFWRAHPSRFLQREIVSPLNLDRVEMGPMSLTQAVLATTPLQLAVGYADSLQLDVPLTGRALYGSMAGRFQTQLTAASDSVAMDVRMNMDLKNIQAGAIAMRNVYGHTRVVEDEFNGKVAMRSDNFVLDRDSLAAMQRGLISESQLQTIDMSVSVERAEEAKHFSGTFQASTGMRINLVNEVLNKIIEDLRLTAPPRSMTYKDLAVKLDIERGVVQHREPFLRLGGLQLASTEHVEVEGMVKAHLGRPEERVRLSDLIAMMRGIAGLVETD
jgi:hypothetical protein